MAEAEPSRGDRRAMLYRKAMISGWRAIFFSARMVSSRPGETLGQGDAPEGWGRGMKSNFTPLWSRTNFRLITSSSFSNAMNCAMASLPTGMTRRGRRIWNSSFIQDEQFRISSGAGTRSLPPGAFPGKQRHTAAKYTSDLKEASFNPQNSSIHRKSVLPAVQANGLPRTGSRTPGACPTSITLLRTAPPETGGGSMRGQRRHCTKRAT